MLRIQLMDNSKSRYLDPDLSNKYCKENPDQKHRAQEDYYNYIISNSENANLSQSTLLEKQKWS